MTSRRQQHGIIQICRYGF